MAQNRPQIPAEIKRRVRERCGYGCVLCGRPICEYHHINGYNSKTGHVENDITMLCDGCHRKTTNGIFSRKEIGAANSTPFNKRRQNSLSTPDTVWLTHSRECCISVASNSFSMRARQDGYVIILAMDGNPVISLRWESDHWLLSLKIYDEMDNPLLIIQNNEMSYRTSDVDDIVYHGGVFTIARNGQTAFQAKFFGSHFCLIQADLWWNGIHFPIKEGNLGDQSNFCGNTVINEIGDYSVAIIVGRNPNRCTSLFGFPAATRTLGGRSSAETSVPIKDWGTVADDPPSMAPERLLDEDQAHLARGAATLPSEPATRAAMPAGCTNGLIIGARAGGTGSPQPAAGPPEYDRHPVVVFAESLLLFSSLDLSERWGEYYLQAGLGYSNSGYANWACDFYTLAIGVRGAHPQTTAHALRNRGIVRLRCGQALDAISDFDEAMQIAGVPRSLVLSARFGRARAYRSEGSWDLATEDFTTILAAPESSPEMKADALISRAITHGMRGRPDLEVDDYERVAQLAGSTATQRAHAQYNRAAVHAEQGRFRVAIQEYAALAATAEAPTDQRAKAILAQSRLLALSCEYADAAARYRDILKMGDAPDNLREQAASELRNIPSSVP